MFRIEATLNATPDGVLPAATLKQAWEKGGKTALAGAIITWSNFSWGRRVGVNRKHYPGQSALAMADSCRQIEVVEMLLKHRADPSTRAYSGNSPLPYAALNGHYSSVISCAQRAPTTTLGGIFQSAYKPMVSPGASHRQFSARKRKRNFLPPPILTR